MFYKKVGQIWVETVIYTLISLSLIGAVLFFVNPKIQELRDNAIIEQSLSLMGDINSVILSVVNGGPGNTRLVELNIKKGSLIIDGENDIVFFEMESKSIFSEPGKEIQYGNTKVYTEKKGDFNLINLTNNYKDKYDIKYDDKDVLGKLESTGVPQKIFISNLGGNKIIINFGLE